MKRNFTNTFLFAALLAVVALAITSCGKSGNATPVELPDLTTMDVVVPATDGTIAYTGGLFNAQTDVSLSAFGICYSSTNQTPTIADNKTKDTVLQLAYLTKLKGLTAKTTYYARAYATNSAGTGYGKVIQFTTSDGTAPAGGTVTTLAGNNQDFIDGLGEAAAFDGPQGLTYATDGNLYVADSYNSAIRKLTLGGNVTTLTGNGTIGYVDGTLADARFYAAQGVVMDASGNIYVADYGNNNIRKITPAGVVSTFAGSGDAGYTDGTGTKATFNNPRALAIDATGNIYVADQGNNLIRKITPAGVVTTFAGSRGASYYDNATPTSATFNKPNGIAIDAAGNIYVAEALNHAIRKITTAGVVTTFAGGNKRTDFVGSPAAITFDASGNMFIADQNGRILEITKDKVLKSVAGKAGVNGYAEGVGEAAQFNSPQGIAVDAAKNVYVSDYYNNRVRKIALP
ncbi:NHL repeat-containing protein [Mucilaginibacter oryzae]|uniref:NHL repeat-containing protein n=1 Tax=Mucilaginibacter oryzae TaxID=468058 RepID=A0A316H1V2_9SPHI|nr:NHL repeat-containing protein [Mucilaginibacter oryzae]PWK71413.1 NHL repeat-containing protein [Mucilaginibacter oryzae]